MDIHSWVAAISLGLLGGSVMVIFWLLQYATKLRVGIKKSRVELSRLRLKGVKLRNQGRNIEGSNDGWIENDTDYIKWETNIQKWNKNVYKAIKQISVADAEWYSTLDVVEPPRLSINAIDEQHTHQYAMHDCRLRRLGEMIRDLWGKDG